MTVTFDLAILTVNAREYLRGLRVVGRCRSGGRRGHGDNSPDICLNPVSCPHKYSMVLYAFLEALARALVVLSGGD